MIFREQKLVGQRSRLVPFGKSLPYLSRPLAAGITPVARWSSGHNSTVSIESCTAGLPPVFGRACASFIFHHMGLGSSATTLNSKATLIARDLGSVLAAYLLCYHMMGLYLCYCLFNFQGSEEGHRNVPSLGRQRERVFCARFAKITKKFLGVHFEARK